jgi:hypothetical protein
MLLAALIGMATARFPAMAEAPAKTLEDELQQVHLTLSVEAFQAGGVTMADAVLELRMRTAFPISFESVEYDRDKDRMTLGDVLESFRALKARSDLSPAEAARLKMYEEMAVHQSTATPVGVRKKTFTLIQDHITVRAFLDRITQLDGNYLRKKAEFGDLAKAAAKGIHSNEETEVWATRLRFSSITDLVHATAR